MNYRQASNEVLCDLFLQALQGMDRELGRPVPTALISEGAGDKPEQLIGINISASCDESIEAFSGLLIAPKSVAETIYKFLGSQTMWEQLEDSEIMNIVMAPWLKELWSRLYAGDAKLLRAISLAA